LKSIASVAAASLALLATAFLLAIWLRIWTRLLELAPMLGHFHGLLIGALALAAPVLLAHKFLPAERLPLLDLLPGVAVTVFCSIAFGAGFGAYLAAFPLNYVSTYAGLASVMIALVFLYSIAAIFVFGGELNGAILRARQKAKAV
jgi:membrane protein